jgi:hypothetical protein
MQAAHTPVDSLTDESKVHIVCTGIVGAGKVCPPPPPTHTHTTFAALWGAAGAWRDGKRSDAPSRFAVAGADVADQGAAGH